jgi:hypothetical protein
MTDDSIALRELLEKSADADLLREMIGFAAERLMELEVQSLAGAPAKASVPRTDWRSRCRGEGFHPVRCSASCKLNPADADGKNDGRGAFTGQIAGVAKTTSPQKLAHTAQPVA